MEPTEEPVTVEPPIERTIYINYMTVSHADDVTFTVAGRVFFITDHGFQKGDAVKVTIEKVR
jgi:predicted RNA-binding protein with TRAM domain